MMWIVIGIICLAAIIAAGWNVFGAGLNSSQSMTVEYGEGELWISQAYVVEAQITDGFSIVGIYDRWRTSRDGEPWSVPHRQYDISGVWAGTWRARAVSLTVGQRWHLQTNKKWTYGILRSGQ